MGQQRGRPEALFQKKAARSTGTGLFQTLWVACCFFCICIFGGKKAARLLGIFL
ncbi:hypothetical protein OBV_11470 [Oscillibacter valericigenes Sjm18-20]|nr:hypothetical protein OBV_11470 [Oscillibacter valericigenes Sjm18-20]